LTSHATEEYDYGDKLRSNGSTEAPNVNSGGTTKADLAEKLQMNETKEINQDYSEDDGAQASSNSNMVSPLLGFFLRQ
jgi:hypothetical protein